MVDFEPPKGKVGRAFAGHIIGPAMAENQISDNLPFIASITLADISYDLWQVADGRRRRHLLRYLRSFTATETRLEGCTPGRI